MNGRLLFLTMFAGITAMGGCDNNAKMNQQSLMQENRELRDSLATSQQNLDDAQAQSRQLEFQLNEANDQAANAQAQPTVSDFGPGVEVFQFGGEMIVRIDGDVLFDPENHESVRKNRGGASTSNDVPPRSFLALRSMNLSTGVFAGSRITGRRDRRYAVEIDAGSGGGSDANDVHQTAAETLPPGIRIRP